MPRRLLDYLRLEAEGRDQSRDAIQTWAIYAQEEAAEFDWTGVPPIRVLDEAVGIYMPASETAVPPEKPTTMAWHDHTGVIIPIVDERAEIRLEYIPDPKDDYRVDRLRYRHATPQHASETILDWRNYFGRNSGIFDGWTMMRRSGRGYVASFVGAGGFVVGTVLRRLTLPTTTLTKDPLAESRLQNSEAMYPLTRMQCPNLAGVPPARMSRAMVWVHGTLSCGIVGLRDLFIPNQGHLGGARGTVFRFEHDTFLKMRLNARELCRLAKERLAVDHLLLAGHSRGGCVARLAADLLQKDGYRGEISVYTFGTPHEGTPLVEIGKTALNLLVKLSQEFIEAAPLPVLSPLTKAVSYSLDSLDLPAGIKDMGKDGEAEALKDLFPPTHGRSWGSDFDLNGNEPGFGVGGWGVLRGALGDQPHDLVVPTGSALAFGTREPALACSHVRYFLEPSIRAAINQFLVPNAAPNPAAVMAAIAGTVEPTSAGADGKVDASPEAVAAARQETLKARSKAAPRLPPTRKRR